MWAFVIAAELCLLVIVVPVFWGALVAFLVLSFVGIRFRPPLREQLEPNPASLLLLTGAPVVVIAFAIWQRGAMPGKPDGLYWQDVVLYGLFVAQVLVAAWLVRRLRNRWLAVVTGLLTIWYTAGALFFAAMAIPDVWL